MTTPRDPEVILAAWLDEHAIPLPASTQRAIDVAIQEIPQRRRSSRLPRRTEPMSLILRFGMAAAAVLIVAVGAATVLRPPSDPGLGASASPSVSSSPSPDPSTWSTFTSDRYGFEVRYPAGWDVYPATGQYQPGVDNEDQVVSDRITVGAGFSGLYSSSTPREVGTAPDQWIERYVCPCGPDVGEWESRTVDGEPALQAITNGGEQMIEVYVFTDERVYRFIGVNLLVRDQPLWEAFLSTIRLHPEDAIDAP
jgi:hypothetical protein